MRPCKGDYYQPASGRTAFENGLFHQWASGFQEFEEGPGNYTYAIVELTNGEVKKVLPCNLKFMDREV